MNVCVRNKISVDLPADYRTVLITAGIRESDEQVLKRILEERIISLYRGIVLFGKEGEYQRTKDVPESKVIDKLTSDMYLHGNEYVVSQLYRAGELNLAPEIYQICSIPSSSTCSEQKLTGLRDGECASSEAEPLDQDFYETEV